MLFRSLNDKPFYPTEVDFVSITYNGVSYVTPANTPTYSSVSLSDVGEVWSIEKITSVPIGVTDIVYANGLHIITTKNSSTPIFRSVDGVNWTSNGQFTPYDAFPYDSLPYDQTSLYVDSTSLNSVSYRSSLFVAVGENIVTSTEDRKSTRLNSSHSQQSRMPSSA